MVSVAAIPRRHFFGTLFGGVFFYFLGGICMGIKKRWLALLLLVTLVCLVFTTVSLIEYIADIMKYDTYEIQIEAVCVLNNQVGTDWTKTFIMDEQEIGNKHRIKVLKGEIVEKSVHITITEQDKHSDTTNRNIHFLLRDNQELLKTITVKENNGRYKNNIAEWEIKILVEKV